MNDGTNMQRLAELRAKRATEFSSPEALKEYLHDHPGADKSKHTVTKGEEGGGSKKDEGDDDKKPVALSREGYKAVANALQGFEGKGHWTHVISYANSGKPMEPQHVKKVVSEIDTYLRSWTTYAEHNKWTPKDKKNLTMAKGILENSLKGGGKTAGQVVGNSADMRAASTKTAATWSYLLTKLKNDFLVEVLQAAQQVAKSEGIPDARASGHTLTGTYKSGHFLVEYGWDNTSTQILVHIEWTAPDRPFRKDFKLLVGSADQVASESLYQHFQGFIV